MSSFVEKSTMRKTFLPSLLLLLVLIPAASGCSENVKQPAVAGAFYPADANVLRAMVDAYLAAAKTGPEKNGRLIALVAPHAGYQFSGQVAAYSYSHIKEREVETVVLIGASHYAAFSGASVYAGGSMATPLGNIRINEKIAGSLLNEKAQVTFNADAFAREHSLEVQLPFLQQSLKEFAIVPILIGAPTQESFSHLSEKLTEILRRDPKTIIVASTDLSHYHDYKTAMDKDMKVADAVSRMSLEDLERALMSGEGEMCGSYPVLLTMAVARNLGATNGELYKYANSGDVTGDKGRVVGYAAMGLYQSPLVEEQKKELLGLAKRTIVEYVKNRRTPEPKVKDRRLLANGATFVTINRNHMLRGCIGNIQPVMPLYQSVVRNAVSACSRDRRFTPMTRQELKDMDVEVTILSPLEPLADMNDIKVGTHGLFIVKGDTSGILLPQVAVEYGWDARTFLEQVSVKAGLPKDAWKDKDAKLYIYTADIVK
jgi:AmmeMemoRadiSam system protein B/AmmeMemoRadiSam system protein A